MFGWFRAEAGAGFLLETEGARRLWIGAGQDFDGHRPVQTGVVGLVDDAHAPAADLAAHVVA
jgi:hypothetical protein